MIYWGVYILRAPWPKSRSASRLDGHSNCDKAGLNCAVGALDCLFCLEKVATGWLILVQRSVSCQRKQCRNAGEAEERQSSPITRQSRPVPVLMQQSTNFELFWNLLDTNNVNVIRRICIEGTDQQTQINHCLSFLLHLLVFPPVVEKLHGLPGALVLPGICKDVALNCLCLPANSFSSCHCLLLPPTLNAQWPTCCLSFAMCSLCIVSIFEKCVRWSHIDFVLITIVVAASFP